MEPLEAIKRITAPFITHGVHRSDEEVLQRLAEDYVARQIEHYSERVNRLKSIYRMELDEFAAAVQALCAGSRQIALLENLNRAQQIMRAEDDLEEWQAAEDHLTRWQAIEADLRHVCDNLKPSCTPQRR